MSEVITEPGQVTPELLTEILGRIYRGWRGAVSSVHVVLTKELPYSQVSRFVIEYSGERHNSPPRRLFLKLSSSKADPGKPENSEVDFYRTVGAKMSGAPLIRCYDAKFSPASGKSHLLLEDLSETHFQTKQGAHPSPIHSELAVKSLARFHAVWWQHPNIGAGIGKVFDESCSTHFL